MGPAKAYCLTQFVDNIPRLLFHRVAFEIAFDDVFVSGLVIGRESVALKVVVDDYHLAAIDVKPTGKATVA